MILGDFLAHDTAHRVLDARHIVADPVERFEAFFVKKAKQPGVTSLEEFEQRWRTWIDKLIALQLGGPEQADALIARGRNQAKHGKLDAAAATFRWALRKRPQDPVAMLELAKLHAARRIGFGERGDANLCAEKVVLGPDSSVVEGRFEGRGFLLKVGAPGRHFAMNALAVYGAACFARSFLMRLLASCA